MTELLVVKAGDDFYRFNNNRSKSCTMNQASVFSLAQVEEVRTLCLQLQHTGISANIVKLTILEELFLE